LLSRRPGRAIVASANRVKKWGEKIGDRARITPHQAPYQQLARMDSLVQVLVRRKPIAAFFMDQP